MKEEDDCDFMEARKAATPPACMDFFGTSTLQRAPNQDVTLRATRSSAPHSSSVNSPM
jgi:hypothetical protein